MRGKKISLNFPQMKLFHFKTTQSTKVQFCNRFDETF